MGRIGAWVWKGVDGLWEAQVCVCVVKWHGEEELRGWERFERDKQMRDMYMG